LTSRKRWHVIAPNETYSALAQITLTDHRLQVRSGISGRYDKHHVTVPFDCPYALFNVVHWQTALQLQVTAIVVYSNDNFRAKSAHVIQNIRMSMMK
jgi:hypothetical protein